MCVLKMDLKLNVVDYFAPSNEYYYSSQDMDLGNTGPLIIPNTKLLFVGSTKYGQGTIKIFYFL